MKRRLFLRIISESLKILFIASLISSIGGFGLQSVEESIYRIVPLMILFPTLNNMIGGFGTVISSKFTSLLYEGRVRDKLLNSGPMREMFTTLFFVVLLSSLIVAGVVFVASLVSGYVMTFDVMIKVFFISVTSTFALFVIISVIAVVGGLYIHRHNQDPDNFLIPMTTSIADLGNLLIFTLLVILLF